MLCGVELAIESDCTPNCCWTCKALKRADSSSMFASTRLPTPVVSASVSDFTKSLWMLSRFSTEPNCAAAAVAVLIAVSTSVSAVADVTSSEPTPRPVEVRSEPVTSMVLTARLPLVRSIEASRLALSGVALMKFRPLNSAALATLSICWISWSTSDWILAVSTPVPFAWTTLPLIWVSRLLIVSAPLLATPIVEVDRARLSEMALKPETSPRIAVAIAQVDESSLAVWTRRLELMRAWVWTRLRAVVLIDCRAAMAPTLVRMLDIEFLPHKSVNECTVLAHPGRKRAFLDFRWADHAREVLSLRKAGAGIGHRYWLTPARGMPQAVTLAECPPAT